MALPGLWKQSKDNEIRSGGQATVTKVGHRDHVGVFALKRLTRPLRQDRFRREIERMRVLYEAGIRVPPIVDFDATDNRPWLVMPWYEKGSLDSYLSDNDRSISVNLELLKLLAQALDGIHSHELAHRDLKPGNILIDDEGGPVVADFGLCMDLQDERLTETWEAIGSRYFLPPENESGINLDQDQRPADAYAFGKIMWCLLAKQRALPREYQLEHRYRLENLIDSRLKGLDQLNVGLLNADPRARLTDWSQILREIDLATESILVERESVDRDGDRGTIEKMRRSINAVENRVEVQRARRGLEEEQAFRSVALPALQQNVTRLFVDHFRPFAEAFDQQNSPFYFAASPGGTNLSALINMLNVPEDIARRDYGSNSWGSLIAHNNALSGMRGELWASIYPLISPTAEVRFVRVLHLIQRYPNELGQFIHSKSGSFPGYSSQVGAVGYQSAEVAARDFIDESHDVLVASMMMFVEGIENMLSYADLASRLREL